MAAHDIAHRLGEDISGLRVRAFLLNRLRDGALVIVEGFRPSVAWLLLERRVGLGRDNGTPVGVFSVAVRQKDPSWFRPGEPPIPAGDPRNVLGSRWLGFKATEELSGYGIHGTDDAGSIGSESSAGCVRLRNEDIETLYRMVPVGTPVYIY